MFTPNSSTALPGTFYWSGYYPPSSANYWTNTNTGGFGDFTVNGTIPTPTALQTANWNAVSKATSSFPGINFSAPRTGVIKITAMVCLIGSNNATSAVWGLKLLESTTSTDLAFVGGSQYGSGATVLEMTHTLVGYFPATASTTYNFKLQGVVASVTMFIGGVASSGAELSFALEYIS